jgi:hypothetical protein
MKNIFKPEDLNVIQTNHPLWGLDDRERYIVCEHINTKLNELIESWPRVYSNKDANGDYFEWSKDPYAGCEVKALLSFIEPIKRECVKHEPIQYGGLVGYKCMKCGVELVAEWKVKEG